MLVDTGGIDPFPGPMLVQMRRQAEIAIDSADAIVLVCDLRSGVTANDADVAVMLQKSGKPVILCVNKAILWPGLRGVLRIL
jgi:GTP-binding protein